MIPLDSAERYPLSLSFLRPSVSFSRLFFVLLNFSLILLWSQMMGDGRSLVPPPPHLFVLPLEQWRRFCRKKGAAGAVNGATAVRFARCGNRGLENGEEPPDRREAAAADGIIWLMPKLPR